jgi:hypothetical protein
VCVEIDGDAVPRAQHLEDTVAVEEAAIEDRDRRVLGRAARVSARRR